MSDRRPTPSGSVARPFVTLFSEARLHRNLDGDIQAVDASNAAAAWDAYVEGLGSDRWVGKPPGSAGRPALRVAAAWCRLGGRRYAVEVIGDPVEVLGSGVLGPVGRLLAPAGRGWMRWVAAGASAGHFVTEGSLKGLYPLAPGVPEHSFSLVNLADEDFTAEPRSDPRPVQRLIAVGTHNQLYKGHDDLIRALALLAARGLDLHLGLVGDGRYHDRLRQLARASRVEDRVTFHGRVNAREDLRRLLDDADLFCMPSRTEGQPRALIEAMARGVPAIGTAVGGIPELIEPRFCTRPNDPEALAELIATFADGTVDLALVSREVWRRAQHFTPSQQTERIANWLGEIARLAGSDT